MRYDSLFQSIPIMSIIPHIFEKPLEPAVYLRASRTYSKTGGNRGIVHWLHRAKIISLPLSIHEGKGKLSKEDKLTLSLL